MARQRADLQQLELVLKEKANELQVAQQVIHIGIRALSVRMLEAFALFADCVMFGWALANGSYQALAGAVMFAISAWCVLHLRLRKEHENEEGHIQ